MSNKNIIIANAIIFVAFHVNRIKMINNYRKLSSIFKVEIVIVELTS
jgi:hypothetical protein